jgi:16S rRNA (guanine527-N7)-methyltransferase
MIDILLKYFPELTSRQQEQFAALQDLYADWNSKINLISRKDIENLQERHVLHSLGIVRIINFRPGTSVLDVGTGGGFPGIPLAIMFPETQFCLIDSIGKKIKAATGIAESIGLQNAVLKHLRAEEEKGKYDFIVSRAVMPLGDLLKLTQKNIKKEQQNSLPNGLICLKGGDMQAEIFPYRNKATVYDLSREFDEEFFATKKVVYVPM